MASPAVSTEKTPDAVPTEKPLTGGSGTPEAAAPDRPPSSRPLSLYDIEAFLARMVRSTEPDGGTALKTAMREDGTGWKHGATNSISLPCQQCEAELRANFGDGMKE